MWKIMMKAILIYMFVFGAWLAVGDERAHACSCAETPGIEDQLNRKTAIFTGKVKSVKQPDKGTIWSSADPVKVQFEVKTVWKGEVSSQTTVYTALSSESCGYEGFKVNEEFIVFAYGEPDRLETGLCEGNKTIAAAQEELKALGAGYEPVKRILPQTDPTVNNSETGRLVIILAVAVSLILFFLLIKSFKRRGRS